MKTNLKELLKNVEEDIKKKKFRNNESIIVREEGKLFIIDKNGNRREWFPESLHEMDNK